MGFAPPGEGEFATTGLGRYVPDVRFRVLVLAADPDRYVVDFNPELRDWWLRQRPNPFDERMSDWGRECRLTAGAAIRCGDRVLAEGPGWHEYLALHRSGSIEFGSGRPAVYSVGPGVSVFRLIYMVGRLWSMLDLYYEVIERFSLKGPWEISIALRNTGDSRLGHLGSGWPEPVDSWSLAESSRCLEPYLLIIRELAEWPVRGDLRGLVYSIADNIENAWGSDHRRYLAHEGRLAGEFDASRYR